MLNKKYKWGAVFLTGLLSIVVIFLGSQMTRGQAQETSSATATSVQSEQVKLERLQKQLNNLFIDEQAGFLKLEITLQEVEKLENEIEKLSDFSKGKKATTYTEKRNALQQALAGIRIQIDAQTQLNELFEAPIADFQTIEEDTGILNQTVTEDQLTKLAETLAQYPTTNQWYENMVTYQVQAQKQWDEIDAIQKAIQAFTEPATRVTQTDIDDLTTKISQVLSSEWQTVLTEQLAQLSVTPVETKTQTMTETSDTQTTESTTPATSNNQANQNNNYYVPTTPQAPNNQNNNYYTPTTPVTPAPTPTPNPTPVPTPTPDSGQSSEPEITTPSATPSSTQVETE